MSTNNHKIDVIIPAYNEEDSITKVIADIPDSIVREIIVVDNASNDNTKVKAQEAGATVLYQKEPGYGNACLKGIEYLTEKSDKPDVVVFLDGDYSDYPEQMVDLVQPILEEDYDLVIGSRARGQLEKGAMQPHQVFGNWLATSLIKLFYGVAFTDLGPFRAIKFDELIRIEMVDQNYGWTVEMQVKAAKMRLKCKEIPVDYRKRIGVSKISGTIKGSFLAGQKIIWTIFLNLIK